MAVVRPSQAATNSTSGAEQDLKVQAPANNAYPNSSLMMKPAAATSPPTGPANC